jgi:ParB-like chromosome segregation protein Spo0J
MSINIEYVDVKSLVVPDWRATYTLRPDLITLSSSLIDFGFIEPIHVVSSTGHIIDGSERYLLATNVKRIIEVVGTSIPVVKHDVDLFTAQLMHLRLNRGRGAVKAKEMSKIIKTLVRSKMCDHKTLERVLGMKVDEYALMLDGTILKSRNIKEHKYSRAWVPVEAPAGTVDSGPIVESPPNEDR